jgi:hypothetical protein
MDAVNRHGDGRFKPGHAIPGPGRPGLAELNKARQALSDAITPELISEAVGIMVEIMRTGKNRDRLTAIGMLLDRRFGPVSQSDVAASVEELETRITELLSAVRDGRKVNHE